MPNLISKLFSWYFSRNALPYWGILFLDSCAIVFAGLVASYIDNGGEFIAHNFWRILTFWICSLPLFFVGMRACHTYSGVIRYSSFVDLLQIAFAISIGGILVGSLCFILQSLGVEIPYDIILDGSYFIAFIIAILLQWSLRIIVKYAFDTIAKTNDAKRVFIYGVREGGISIAKSMRNEHPIRYIVKGFVADEPEMQGRHLLGTCVYAPNEELINTMRSKGANTIYISPLCSEQFRENDKLIRLFTKAGIRMMMMAAAESWDGKSDLSYTQLHEVDIEDLLPREKITVDLNAIGEMLRGKRILITGAAGSIGSEMSRQIAKFAPSELVLVDQAETPMHDVRLYMTRNHPSIKCWTIVGSICNPTHMEDIFNAHRPEYVFHAAAYKHVPMMEDNPAMAIQNNVYGTRVIADLAVKYGTKKFVMISTDKAVNPTNVMGCSKRICEIYCQALNAKLQKEGNKATECNPQGIATQFITTRFGNVLGSNGSVIPIFREQIRRGGPVTVTHPEIIRFFMLIPEACQLVLEAGTMGKGGEIFVFDMGKPVRIADLAQRMIDLSGAQGIEIKFTGLRDGEKLFEEVLNDKEQTKPTIHPKIKIAAVREYPYDMALKNEQDLHQLSFTYDDMAIVSKMKEIVPEYKSKQSKYEALDQKG